MVRLVNYVGGSHIRSGEVHGDVRVTEEGEEPRDLRTGTVPTVHVRDPKAEGPSKPLWSVFGFPSPSHSNPPNRGTGRDVPYPRDSRRRLRCREGPTGRGYPQERDPRPYTKEKSGTSRTVPFPKDDSDRGSRSGSGKGTRDWRETFPRTHFTRE